MKISELIEHLQELDRERARRDALWMMQFPKHHAKSLADLDLIERLDAEYPVGEAAAWSAAEARERVPQLRHSDPPYLRVRLADIPEPWRTRMRVSMHGSSIFETWAAGDWGLFLSDWERAHEDLRNYRTARGADQ